MRNSWDTSIKHLTRSGAIDYVLTAEQIASIPRSNISRWKNEADDKYSFCELNDIITQEIELIKRLNQSSNIKKINQGYFKLADTFHKVISKVKGLKSLIKGQKEIIIDVIEQVKDFIPINTALKVFNISRSTFENYKSILIHKCEVSYFNWCTKRFPNQLLPKEVKTIKTYMDDDNYKHWSKSSIYLKSLRDEKLQCCVSTFYKYCRLLGFKNRPRRKKSDSYTPVRTTRPNKLWCADVTIFKTADNVKHYIHFLIDHYSKMILGYRIEKSASAIAIKSLVQNACLQHKPDKLQFLTDGGSENVNSVVSNFINAIDIPIKHLIAQKDVVFSNSMIEAINKIIKHQFLFPKELANGNQLTKLIGETIPIYNTIRPQMSLGGNTPQETFNGLSIDISRYTHNFKEQKTIRIKLNGKNACNICI
ncbi:DDE-type integrase/transposase/recombinase [Aequorivita sp. KMM 9714]|uniref:DDE-type integrase/transposase/recombinase n=1 Tax=Aequorivita sp. KMM 9714 TaxID=2707173 RepID=UPI0013EABBA6|nr:DDE-type integrase/transposase/recombinase [Aequorivita sp. KMM 9714]NGX85371.1 DDE-type integrase/transposase/recombinase [Aequorivita sp. KMM 9714]